MPPRSFEPRDRFGCLDGGTDGEPGAPEASGAAEGNKRPAHTAPFQTTGLNRRRRRLFATTKIELSAIAAPAIIGLSRPAAASGSAATL
jgi:hypothetical protein